LGTIRAWLWLDKHHVMRNRCRAGVYVLHFRGIREQKPAAYTVGRHLERRQPMLMVPGQSWVKVQKINKHSNQSRSVGTFVLLPSRLDRNEIFAPQTQGVAHGHHIPQRSSTCCTRSTRLRLQKRKSQFPKATPRALTACCLPRRGDASPSNLSVTCHLAACE
jgi:hypothetical protein